MPESFLESIFASLKGASTGEGVKKMVNRRKKMPQVVSDQIEFAGMKARLTRKRVRSVNLRIVPPNGDLRISAPIGMPLSEIVRFAESKRDWIQRHIQRMRTQSEQSPSRTYDDGEQHPLWGESFPIRLSQVGTRATQPMGLRDGAIVLPAYPHSTIGVRERALHRVYEKELRSFIEPLIPVWESRIGVRVKEVTYRRMKSRWGSCTMRKGTIRLNTELARHPREAAEYVLVHELVHLIEPSHNTRFWGLVGHHCPEWKRIRHALNHGGRTGC